MANNPYVNKVEMADGTSLMDISDTTAEPSNVAAGEVFYSASGARSVGTGTLNIIDDTAGDGNTDKAWSADKLFSEFAAKADAENPVFTGTISNGRRSGTEAGIGSTAIGADVAATGSYSHAEGNYTTASGFNAHAEGVSTTSSGNGSHSEGDATTASGDYSHAEGLYTTAQRKSQHVSGEYNVLDTTGTTSTHGAYVEIVGCGTSDSARANARALDWSGNEYLNGDIYINCGDNSTGGTAVGTALAGKLNTTDVATTTETQAIIDEYGVSA